VARDLLGLMRVQSLPNNREHCGPAGIAELPSDRLVRVQRLLGHEKASMTLDVYADLFDHDLDDVATRLDEDRAAGLADYVRTKADATGLRVV